MNLTLSTALAELNLQPGQSTRVPVEDYAVEVRRLHPNELELLEAIPDIRLSIPPSQHAVTVTATLGAERLHSPFILDEWELTPE